MSADAASAPPAQPPPKIDNMKGLARAHPAQGLIAHAKKEYGQVLDQLKKDGVIGEVEEESARDREERRRIIQHPLMQPVHTDVARRAYSLVKQNGGIYNKLGQFVASLASRHPGVPRQYVDELRQCTDQCPPRPLSDFAELIREDLGRPREELFESFDEEPIGAASLAQVHRAVTKDGRVVAVKLQYPGLRDQLATDFFIFRCLAGMAKNSGIDLSALINDFEATVTRELDFAAEARNGELTRHALRHWHPAVYVPATVPALCGPRVLTMEFAEGCATLNPRRLAAVGLSTAEVARLICEVSAEMACCHGRVHGDPHAGNVYARPRPGGRAGEAQVVLLDHGVYHTISEDARRDICHLLLACAAGRRAEMRRLSERFAGPLGRFFPLVLSPWFIFGTSVSLADLRAARRRDLPPSMTQQMIRDTIMKLVGSEDKIIGVLHSLGYTRALLCDLLGAGGGEYQRVMALVRAARLGLEDERYRPGAADARGDPPELGAPLRPAVAAPPLPLAVRAGQWRAALHVRVTALIIAATYPLARLMEPAAGPTAAAAGSRRSFLLAAGLLFLAVVAATRQRRAAAVAAMLGAAGAARRTLSYHGS